MASTRPIESRTTWCEVASATAAVTPTIPGTRWVQLVELMQNCSVGQVALLTAFDEQLAARMAAKREAIEEAMLRGKAVPKLQMVRRCPLAGIAELCVRSCHA